MKYSLTLCFFLLITWAQASTQAPKQFDVVIYGATPGGISSAISAAREGASVALFEELYQVGGLTTGGLSHPDFRTLESLQGIYREFMNRVLKHYTETYGPNSRQVKDSFYGTHAEPRVAKLIFEAWLAEYPNIRVFTQHRLQSVTLTKLKSGRSALTGAVFANLLDNQPVEVKGAVFIDGTYEGDLMAKAGCEYRVGRESRQEYGEIFAGKVYYHDQKFWLGSTGDADNAIQGYNFRVCMTDSAQNRLPIPKPEAYDRATFLPLLTDIKQGKITRFADQIVKIQPIPNRKADVNDRHFAGSMSLSRPGWSYEWPDGSPQKRQQIFQRHLNYTLGLFYLLQNDPEVPTAIQQEARQWGLPKDEYPENGHFTPSLYVREGRRLVGEFIFQEKHCQQAPDGIRGYWQADAVAVGDYGLNSHGCNAPNRYHPTIRDGAFSLYYSNLPYQIPYGVMVPKTVDGLLVPVAVSSSHVGYSALRYEPIWMALGQAAGLAAAQTLKRNVPVRNIDVTVLQKKLHQAGAITAYFSDVFPDSPYFQACQYFASQGYFHNVPDRNSVPFVDHFVSINGQYSKAFPYHAAELDKLMDKELAEQWLSKANQLSSPLRTTFNGLTRGQFLHQLFKQVKPGQLHLPEE
ncbi:FAD-dependent oxidoreductase [Rudanella paleaurantiibacter]|uniref:FAD-dependent oxidoreductase n=1 Tax=Rudanella paleaurantiibacter TaxID=2614655 RepID=A0A7J5TT46_9BACT|nr:FAD-dependent oxidoreductase [Rudanella paleaurantiibacter]KAB7726870.1 FAD-dependent oxidoreductase [Rudanella paleaurantiibacter]